MEVVRAIAAVRHSFCQYENRKGRDICRALVHFIKAIEAGSTCPQAVAVHGIEHIADLAALALEFLRQRLVLCVQPLDLHLKFADIGEVEAAAAH